MNPFIIRSLVNGLSLQYHQDVSLSASTRQIIVGGSS